jgi:short-subunit dehydrogenase
VTRFADRYGPWALIAGGSEGLGLAFAEQAAGRGLDLVLVARRPDVLEQAAAGLRQRYGVQVRTLAADLAEATTYREALPAATEGLDVGLVVGNAGHAPVGRFLDVPAAQAQEAVELNVRVVLGLSRCYLPGMVQRRRGGFVVMSSAAGLQGSPGLALYAATKAFGRVFAESLWAELRASGVDVVACVPGAVRTPGYEQSGMGHAPGELDSAAVAAQTLDRLRRGPVVVPGRFMRTATATMRLLPRRTAVTVMGRASRDLMPDA